MQTFILVSGDACLCVWVAGQVGAVCVDDGSCCVRAQRVGDVRACMRNKVCNKGALCVCVVCALKVWCELMPTAEWKNSIQHHNDPCA